MRPFEASHEDHVLSAEQQEIWRVLVRRKALHSLEVLETFYLSEEEQESRKKTPLTNERYQEWLAWMEKMDEDPKALFRQHVFVDEGAIAEKSKTFMDAMEALEELRDTQRLSEATKQRLGMEHLECERFIFVPDVEATKLTAIAAQALNLTSLDPDYAHWDFYQGLDGKPIPGRGKIFEAMTWKPENEVSATEVRKHFERQGFHGHTGAFTAWVKQQKPRGSHTSFPEENGCGRDAAGVLCAPYSFLGGDSRELRRGRIRLDWVSIWVYVAFREV